MQLTRRLGLLSVKNILLCPNKHHRAIIEYSTKTNPTSASYCLDSVRKHDYENYLCTLLLPSDYRSSAFAIRAFNIEVARVQDNVSDSRIGHMRMKFWEDTVEKINSDNVPQHPVAVELHHACRRHRLTKRYLKRLIAARSAQLSNAVYADLDAVQVYSEATVSSVYYLLLEAAGVRSVQADHAASHLGKAQGIANVLRAVPHNSAQRVVTLPQDVLSAHGISHEAVLRARSSRPLQDAALTVANTAKMHLDKARSLSKQVPKTAHCILLPAVTVCSYLDKLQAVDFDVFHPQLRRRHATLPLALYWNKLTSSY